MKFKSLIVSQTSSGSYEKLIKDKNISELPVGDILIRVSYSSLNYKDGLSSMGHRGITRSYPHTPGVDASGVIVESKNPNFKSGDEVLVTGYDLGMNTSGGFAQYIRVPSEWVVHLPEGLSLRESMIYGTAGFTAGLCINELESRNITPDCGKVLVSGATGGVGTMAVAMLAKSGFEVVASTGKPEKSEFLTRLGAKEIISRNSLEINSNKPLMEKKWIASIDNIGGNTLANIIKSTEYHGVVNSVGLVSSDKLELTVYPFILRGVTLVGIDSASTPMVIRLSIWEKIATRWIIKETEFFVKEVSLENLEIELDNILQGKQCGRVLVNPWI